MNISLYEHVKTGTSYHKNIKQQECSITTSKKNSADRLYLNAACCDGAPVGPQVVELGASRGELARLVPAPATADDELALEVRQELEVLLLLVLPHHLQLVAEQRLKLLLQTATATNTIKKVVHMRKKEIFLWS